VVPPIAREPRDSVETTRAKLGLKQGERMVLITMGGIPHDVALGQGPAEGWVAVVPGAGERFERSAGVVRLPRQSDFYHPDLVAASQAVLGKAGYSTVAEVYQAGVPFGWVGRPRFPEMDAMRSFIGRRMAGLEVPAASLEDGRWQDCLADLLALPSRPPDQTNGSQAAAGFLLARLRD
jgi:hypothetical protein